MSSPHLRAPDCHHSVHASTFSFFRVSKPFSLDANDPCLPGVDCSVVSRQVEADKEQRLEWANYSEDAASSMGVVVEPPPKAEPIKV